MSDFVPIGLRRALEINGQDADAVWMVLTGSKGVDFADYIFRAQPHYGRKPLLVGEAPGPKSDPSYPLFPMPERCSGGRLAAAMGLDIHNYLQYFRRVNLLDYYPGSRWRKVDRDRAAAAAACLKTAARDLGLVILCGSNVSTAWDHDVPEFEVRPAGRSGRGGYRVVRIPHPSGRNRKWSAPETAPRLREMIRREEPWIAECMEES